MDIDGKINYLFFEFSILKPENIEILVKKGEIELKGEGFGIGWGILAWYRVNSIKNKDLHTVIIC
ncbi:MAG: hypothetical protein HYV28_11075 [Ignavibacteriales bacterium]|nr:hypothetical protein [Ignavibacteriales bacterium]